MKAPKIELKKIKASELQVGNKFKLEGKRKFNLVLKIIDIDGYENTLEPFGPKVLIIVENCRQWMLLKDQEVLILP